MDKLGPTGKHTDPPLDRDDEGELNMAVMVDHVHRVVTLDFGTDLSWIGLKGADAITLGQTLILAGRQLDDGNSDTDTKH